MPKQVDQIEQDGITLKRCCNCKAHKNRHSYSDGDWNKTPKASCNVAQRTCRDCRRAQNQKYNTGPSEYSWTSDRLSRGMFPHRHMA